MGNETQTIEMTSLIYGSETKMDNIENKGAHGQRPEKMPDEDIKYMENIPDNNIKAPQNLPNEQMQSKKTDNTNNMNTEAYSKK